MKICKSPNDFYLTITDSDFQEAIVKLSSRLGDHVWSYIEIAYENNQIILTRIFDEKIKEVAYVAAKGYWPSTIIVLWRNIYNEFKRIPKGKNINITYSIQENFLFLNDCLISCVDGPSQLEFQFTKSSIEPIAESIEKSIHEQIVARILAIDTENSNNTPDALIGLSKYYERDKELSKLIKTLRGSKCQICGFSFKTINNEDFTECHHLSHLANGGLDVSRNILVLCPNHHRQFHYGNVVILEHTSNYIIVKIDDVTYNCNLTGNV